MSTHADVLRVLKSLWTNYSPDAAALDAKLLADVPPDDLLGAIRKYRAEDETGFPPSPGKLRALCGRSKRIEARSAWDRLRELYERTPRAGDSPPRIAAEWSAVHADPRQRAGLRALTRYGGLSGLLSADVDRARKTFCVVFEEEGARLELAGGQRVLA